MTSPHDAAGRRGGLESVNPGMGDSGPSPADDQGRAQANPPQPVIGPPQPMTGAWVAGYCGVERRTLIDRTLMLLGTWRGDPYGRYVAAMIDDAIFEALVALGDIPFRDEWEQQRAEDDAWEAAERLRDAGAAR